MQAAIIYMILSIIVTIFFVAVAMDRAKDVPALTRLLLNMHVKRSIVEQIQNTCDTFRQDQQFHCGDLVIIQCAEQGFVTYEDLNYILKSFPGMIDEPALFRRKCQYIPVTFDELLDEMGVIR